MLNCKSSKLWPGISFSITKLSSHVKTMLLDPEVPKRQLLTQVTFKEKKEETLAVVVGRNIAGASAARVGGFGFGV